jgi:pentatricopeptide repeat protein
MRSAARTFASPPAPARPVLCRAARETGGSAAPWSRGAGPAPRGRALPCAQRLPRSAARPPRRAARVRGSPHACGRGRRPPPLPQPPRPLAPVLPLRRRAAGVHAPFRVSRHPRRLAGERAAISAAALPAVRPPLLRALAGPVPAAVPRAYARAGLPDDGVRAFSSMERFGFPPTLADLQTLLFALSHNGLVEHAEAFFRDSGNQFDVSAKTYTILISGWVVVTKPENARKLFDEMAERGVEPDVPSYNALIDALCRGGDVDLAQAQLKDMQVSRGLVPDAATYGPFLHSACAAKDARAALRLLDRMHARDLTPNVFTYNAVVQLLCEMGEIDEAYNILCEMDSRGEKPDVWSYNALLSEHCKLKEVNKALRLIARMDKHSCMPNRHSYNMLLKMLISVGRIDKAIEVWDGMEKRGFHPGTATYAVMIHGLCCKKGRAEEAYSYFLRMVDDGIPPYQATCQVLSDRLLRLGLRDDIEMFTDRMRWSTSCTIHDLASFMCGKRTEEVNSLNSGPEFQGLISIQASGRENGK